MICHPDGMDDIPREARMICPLARRKILARGLCFWSLLGFRTAGDVGPYREIERIYIGRAGVDRATHSLDSSLPERA